MAFHSPKLPIILKGDIKCTNFLGKFEENPVIFEFSNSEKFNRKTGNPERKIKKNEFPEINLVIISREVVVFSVASRRCHCIHWKFAKIQTGIFSSKSSGSQWQRVSKGCKCARFLPYVSDFIRVTCGVPYGSCAHSGSL